jgi:hypothetical protein
MMLPACCKTGAMPEECPSEASLLHKELAAMDHDTRTKATNRQDPEWATKVIRNIGQIEADFFHAAGHLSEQMMTEAFLAIEKVVAAP